MNLYKQIGFSVVVLLLLLLPAPSSSLTAAPLPPRRNPEFRERLSGIVVVDPRSVGLPGPVSSALDLYRLPSAPLAVPTGPNVLCNQDPGLEEQNEPSIAVNPLNPNHVIASSNDFRMRDFGGDALPGYYVSFDGGLTWPGDGVIPPPDGALAGGDPAMVIYDAGNVYFAFIAFHRTIDDIGGVYVVKSTDGGMNWETPVRVAANTLTVFHDKEYITVDATGSPYDGYVYVSWTRFETNSPIYFSRSTNSGTSFSTPTRVSDATLNSNQGSIPAVGPNGEVYVIWYNYNTTAQRMAASFNGGQTFGAPFHVVDVVPITCPLPGASFRCNSFPTLAVDGTSGSLYVAWNDYRNGDADILFIRSTDGGGSWSNPIRVNDDALGNARHQFFPWLAVAPNGDIYAGWFDSRNDTDPANEPFYYDEYVAVSTDGGLTFSPNARISAISANASIGFGGLFIGDYSGIAATDNFVFPAWVDTRRGHQDIYTQANLQLQAAKTAPAAVDRWRSFSYTVLLSSTEVITDNTLSDPLPPEVSYIPGSVWASSGSYGEAGGVITWTGALGPGQPVTITFQVTATAPCGTTITNTAVLTDGAGGVRSLVAVSLVSGTLPQADFTPSDWSPNVGEVVTFTNQSSGGDPLVFGWDFGDGFTSTLESPTHSYSLPGTYAVSLTATDPCGSDVHTETLSVVCDPPTAALGWEAAGLFITFTNASTGTFALDYHWDFGDGFTSTLESPTHTYALPRAYTVTLSATDLCGSAAYSEVITVTCDAPLPAFTWAASDLIVTFTSASTGTFPLSLFWDFGDSFTSTLESPTHTYALPNTYTVTLRAVDFCGSATHSEAITVTCGQPLAFFTWEASGPLVTFTNASTGIFPLDYFWSFGDSLTSTVESPTHTYALPGTYTVSLKATDLCGSHIYIAPVAVQQPLQYVYLPLVFKELH